VRRHEHDGPRRAPARAIPDALVDIAQPRGELTLDVAPDAWHATCRTLRDGFGFEQCMDICGVDYLGYGSDEWDTTDVSSEGFSRGVEGRGPGRFKWGEQPTDAKLPSNRRFAVVAHLLSIQNNVRLRVRCFAADDTLPVVASVVDLWPGVNWFEREAFDMFGILSKAIRTCAASSPTTASSGIRSARTSR
jgi:NADH-quinone oxidoreductase subunit C